MTSDQLIDLLEKAGMLKEESPGVLGWHPTMQKAERFAALVAAAEREACAEVAEQTVCDTHLPTGVKIYGTRAAKAIRARGQDPMPLFDDWNKDWR